MSETDEKGAGPAQALLCLLFAASGAAALVFETLWFRQTKVLLGSSAWAQALVPAALMIGLGLGSAIAMRRADYFPRPLAAYAFLEIVVGTSGVVLVLLLPRLESPLAPLLRRVADSPVELSLVRLAIALVLLVVPATAMGLTLPVLTRALTAAHPSFGRALGRLYGWNTLGAVGGAVATEAWLIDALGVTKSALVGGALDLFAAAGAFALGRGLLKGATLSATTPTRAERGKMRLSRWLAVAASSGAALLALEVVWFRLMSLYAMTGSLLFALMLAVVLGGIALGALAGSVLLSRGRRSPRTLVAPIAFVAGALTAATYASLHGVVAWFDIRQVHTTKQMFEVAVPLMLPVSTASGLLFTVTGAALREELGGEAQSAGILTLFNTAGAAAGALIAGFALVPSLGMEKTLFAVTALYAGIGLISLARGSKRERIVTGCAGALSLAAMVLFPFGSMRRDHFAAPILTWAGESARVDIREGQTQTVMYAERPLLGHARSWRLITGSFSMSSSDVRNRRYMKLFVYLPVALHPGPKRALLVSFGVGATAKALTDTRDLSDIDIVDISPEILEMSRHVFSDPATSPLADPRVHVHVEDGRFFLQTTEREYDLITSEPPPPNVDGVVNLYSREYFALLRDHLDEGGMVSYWLPLHSLSDSSARSVLHAFCDVFDDCTLWNGIGLDQIMLGTKHAPGGVSRERFTAQWNDDRLVPELRALGLEDPAQLGALFAGDISYARAISDAYSPVTDDYPGRIVTTGPLAWNSDFIFGKPAEKDRAHARFESSDFVRRMFPAGVRPSDALWEAQRLVNVTATETLPSIAERMDRIHWFVKETRFEAPIMWTLGSDDDVERVLASLSPEERDAPEAAYFRAIGLLARRELDEAAAAFGLAARGGGHQENGMLLRAYALHVNGRHEEARAYLASVEATKLATASAEAFVKWLDKTFPK